MKRIAVLIFLWGCCLLAHAEDNSLAMTFASEASAIAGAAQACGIDTAVFSARAMEAMTTLAVDNSDRLNAIMVYSKNTTEARNIESAQRKVPCEMVMQDFNNVPLLKGDYKEVILTKLKEPSPSAAAAPPPPPIPSIAVSPPTVVPPPPPFVVQPILPSPPAAPVQQLVTQK